MILKNITVYSHQLKQPHKSFFNELKCKDFIESLQWDMSKAVKVVYVNPRGESFIIKRKVI